MKKILATAAILAISTVANAQTVSSKHKPNVHTVACLKALTRDCAFKAAIQTVIDEEFGVERSKILVGVARSMIATGNTKDAVDTLMLALEEARAVNLSLVTSEKISVVAPLLARAGDTAGALVLAEELDHVGIKDLTLLKIADEAAALGSIADARVALKKLSKPGRAFWREMRLLTKANSDAVAVADINEIEAKIRAEKLAELKYRGLIILSILAERNGDVEKSGLLQTEADELFQSLVGLNLRAYVAADRANSIYEAGLPVDKIIESYREALSHGNRVRGAEALVTFAEKISAVELANGNYEGIIQRLGLFKELKEKVRYLAGFHAAEPNALISTAVTETLGEIAEVDGAYERDVIRLELLEAAVNMHDLAAAKNIVSAVEDDDNQAFALALLAPLVE